MSLTQVASKDRLETVQKSSPALLKRPGDKWDSGYDGMRGQEGRNNSFA